MKQKKMNINVDDNAANTTSQDKSIEMKKIEDRA